MKEAKMSTEKIHVIAFMDDGVWIAQGLEHDICAQGKNLEEATSRFLVALRLEAEEEGGIERIPAAPQYFHDLWDRRSGQYVPKSKPEYVELALAA